MPENQQFIFTTGSHATYHKSIARDQEDTENRQDKEGEKEIDDASQQETSEGENIGYQKEGRQDGRSFQGRGHGDTPGLGESRVTDDSFIGLAYEKTDKAATDRCQEYAEYCLI